MDTVRGLIIGLLIVAIFIIVIGFCTHLILSQELTSTESSLVGLIISICSILATWIVGHLYSGAQHKKAIQDVQEFHRANLQVYARKAAEKVNNLSQELSRLAIYLGDELSRGDTLESNEVLLSHEERIGSAIHIINTLKSVNDTALSDWEGVIDDLLEEQREEKEEKEEEFRELLVRVEDIAASRLDNRYGDHYDEKQMTTSIESLRKDLRYVAMSLGVSQIPIRHKGRKQKRDVSVSCPKCGKEMNYRQRETKKGYKGVMCKACEVKYVSRYREDEGFFLEARELRVEAINCPECGKHLSVELDTLPCSSSHIECPECESEVRVSRTVEGGVIVKEEGKRRPQPKAKVELTDKVLGQVQAKLPEQPWPRRVHVLVATELCLPNNVVYRAIDQLIRSGIFKPQIDGQLFIPDVTNNKTDGAELEKPLHKEPG